MPISRDIPWPRILAEGVAIVVSILLAFGIEAWWSDRQIRQVVQENLIAVREELDVNLTVIERELIYRRAVISSIEKLNSPNIDQSAVNTIEVDNLLGDLTWIGKSEFSMGALGSILQSGVYTEIENGELQRILASLPAFYENVAEFELRDTESTLGQLFGYMNANGSFNQIINTAGSGRPGTGELKSDIHFRVIEQRDHSQFLQTDEFLGLLTMEWANHSDVVYNMQRLKSKLDKAIELIDLQAPG